MRIYTIYSAALLSLFSASQYFGWSMSSARQVKDIPRTIRDNPGAYRSHYAYLPRYVGGK